jgi:GTPase SAR1 family protein
MRIAISGTSNTGKTTLINSFLHTWSNYETPDTTYRDIIKKKKLAHSSDTTSGLQWDILNNMVDSIQMYDKTSNVIFDRCPLDNIAYTLWAHAKDKKGFDKEFVDKCINIAKEAYKSLDIIFVLRYDKNIKIENNNTRETDPGFIKEIDNIISALHEQYKQNYEADVFFPFNDSPGIVELPTNPQRRIDIIAEYLTPEGEMYGEETSLFNPDNINELEALVQQQQNALDVDNREKELFRKFGLDVDTDDLKNGPRL